jgi:hypothetical protein
MEGNVDLPTCMLYQQRLTCDIYAMEMALEMSMLIKVGCH